MATVREAPRERPILFSAPMVRAILDGRKTQTRRIVPVPEVEFFDGYTPNGDVRWSTRIQPTGTNIIHNRYGAPGDRLWVKETFASDRQEQAGTGAVRWLHPDGNRCGASYRADVGQPTDNGRWHPSIHMPRCLSRIDLEVTGVRVERLQAITEEDARAEGVQPLPIKGTLNGEPMTGMVFDPRMTFRLLWDSINGKRAAWVANPWVWIVSFKRVRP